MHASQDGSDIVVDRQEVAEINDLLSSLRGVDDRTSICVTQVILPTAPGMSNEGRSSPLLALVPAVS